MRFLLYNWECVRIEEAYEYYIKNKGESAMKQPKLQLNNEDKPCWYIINHKVINSDIKDEIRFIR